MLPEKMLRQMHQVSGVSSATRSLRAPGGRRFLPSPRSARHTRSRKACVRNPGPNSHKRFGASGVMRSNAAAVACTRVEPRRARRIIVEKKKTVSYHHRIVPDTGNIGRTLIEEGSRENTHDSTIPTCGSNDAPQGNCRQFSQFPAIIRKILASRRGVQAHAQAYAAPSAQRSARRADVRGK